MTWRPDTRPPRPPVPGGAAVSPALWAPLGLMMVVLAASVIWAQHRLVPGESEMDGVNDAALVKQQKVALILAASPLCRARPIAAGGRLPAAADLSPRSLR